MHDDVLDRLNKNLNSIRANHTTSYEMSCPEDPWIPTCRISIILTIKGLEILFDAILIRSEIVALDFPEDDFLEELQGMDLAHESTQKTMNRPYSGQKVYDKGQKSSSCHGGSYQSDISA